MPQAFREISAFQDGRWMLPAMLLLCYLTLLLCSRLKKRAAPVRGWLITGLGIKHRAYAENRIGSNRENDLVLKKCEPFHGVLCISPAGEIEAIPLDGTISINGKRWKGIQRVGETDKIKLGSETLRFIPAKGKAGAVASPWLQLLPTALVSAALLYTAHLLAGAVAEERFWQVFTSFAILLLCLWVTMGLRIHRGLHTAPALLASFLLSGLSLWITAAYTPESVFIQGLAIGLGIVGHHGLLYFLRRGADDVKLRRAALGVGVLLLLLNFLAASPILGARNWLKLGGVSLQPSELVKICLLMAASVAGGERLYRAGILSFLAFSGFSVLVLLLIHDIGMAVVFFAAYLVMLWCRRGGRAVLLSLAFCASAGALALIVKRSSVQYALDRIASWGTAWENPLTSGYQQTRAMMASASGGLFGCGAGKGWLGTVFASGSDMPFAVLWEEAGFLTAAVSVLLLAYLITETIRASVYGGSRFCVVSCCGAAAFLSVQAVLNLGGTYDLVPFTGVTLPLLSTGGSSMIACWLMLAYPVYADQRADREAGEGEKV